ncbi:MAG TPA: 4Fe-4S binding protein, partial [Candidatus Bathyarchaeia archaeon]|nr:4Fe-4S binding protein [Candidatus Bathyarchaeia archaeon]
IPPDKAEQTLTNMAKKGLLWHKQQNGQPTLRLAPFIVGIYESQLETMDHELAHLVEEYLTNGGAKGIMQPQPALHRVIPAQKAIKTELILPYDDVRNILQNSKTFHLRDCICRVQQDKIGKRRCTFPLRTCLSFSKTERPPHPLDITKEEALALLDKTEKIGLVHTVSNIMKDLGYICNCCGCCCGILRGITDFGIENSVAQANYYAAIDPEKCQNCGTCTKRCQVHAITQKNGKPTINLKKCIGCGLCATGCPNKAATLKRKPKNQIIPPPTDFETWEHQRLHNQNPNPNH